MMTKDENNLCSNGEQHHFQFASTEYVITQATTLSTTPDYKGTMERAVCTRCGLITKNFIAAGTPGKEGEL